jgi:predicted RNA-binding protein with RPS1 domain
MKLIPIIQKINRIQKDISETQTIISTILPIFRYLGWDVFNENKVIFEDVTQTKKRVDITFLYDNNTKLIVEAKRLSHKLNLKDFEQLTAYLNSDDTADYGVLTNGKDYWIADNNSKGLNDKKIYEFNIFDITECDVNILQKFFSYNAIHELSILKKYIDYIKMGLEFGDKQCVKILDIQNFDEVEIESKTSQELQKKQNSTKPKFTSSNQELSLLEPPKSELKKQSFNDFTETEISKSECKNEEKIKDENKIEEDITILKPKKDETIKMFELMKKTEVKIYLNDEYHIIKAKNFQDLCEKVLKYTFTKISSFPQLLSKVTTQLSFIKTRNEIENNKEFKQITEEYYFNSSVENYEKIRNLEELLEFINKNYV